MKSQIEQFRERYLPKEKESLEDWETIQKWANDYKKKENITLIEMCSRAGCHFTPFYYSLLSGKKKPSSKPATLGYSFHKSLNNLKNGKSQPIRNLWSDKEAEEIEKISQDFEELPGDILKIERYSLSPSYRNHYKLLIELPPSFNEDEKKLTEYQKKLNQNSKFQFTIDWIFPESSIECSLVNYSLDPHNFIAGGSSICSSKQPYYSTLGLYLSEINLCLTVAHAITPNPDDIQEHVQNEEIFVFLNGRNCLFGKSVMLGQKRTDFCLFFPTEPLPLIANYVFGIGLIRLPNFDETKELKNLIITDSNSIAVKKYGARTGLTCGFIVSLSENEGLVIAPHHLPEERISDQGDSGSIWVIDNIQKFKNVMIGIHYQSKPVNKGRIRYAFARPIWEITSEIDIAYSNII